MISLALAGLYGRKISRTLQTGLHAFMILSYLLALSGHVGHITEFLAAFEVAGALCCIYVAKKKGNPVASLKDPALVIFLFILIMAFVTCLHMRITNFDDMHYWAIMPRNMFLINGFPTGNMAGYYYRDYFPVVGIMDFLVLKMAGSYRESLLFFVIWGLMAAELLPFFSERGSEGKGIYICRVFVGIIFPFLISFQFLHCIGTDIVVTLLFGSTLYALMSPVSSMEAPDHLGIVLSIALLGMMKTTSLIFAAVCLAVYAVRILDLHNKSSVAWCAAAAALTGGLWISWKVFCRIKGNTTYLSDNLNSNLQGGSFALPPYTGETLRAFLTKLFTYGLNDGKAGLSAFLMLLLFVAAWVVRFKREGADMRDKSSFVLVVLGLLGYLLVMIYIYLFVFEEWEALSLSSYDRYIATYFGALLYGALCYLYSGKGIQVRYMALFAAVLLLTVNFPLVSETLLPGGFMRSRGEIVEKKEAIEAEVLEALGGELPAYGENIVIVDHSSDQLRAKVIIYAAVPGVVKLIQEDEAGNLPSRQELEQTAADQGASRVIELYPRGEDGI